MRQAIVTRFLDPTDTKGARVLAKCDAKTAYVSWDHALDGPENHKRAALALAASLEWGPLESWRVGCLPQKGTRWDYCFVQVDS